MWICRCVCGKCKQIVGYSLVSGNTTSCGCQRGSKGTHHQTHTRLYRIWKAMKCRCYNKNFPTYSFYGGRGITVCDEWRSDFESFFAWATTHGYTEDLTIDRIDSNGNYEPDNCRWITIQKQQRNRCSNHNVTYRGRTQCIAAWAEELNMNYWLLRKRIVYLGWDAEKAFNTPSAKTKGETDAKLPPSHVHLESGDPGLNGVE